MSRKVWLIAGALLLVVSLLVLAVGACAKPAPAPAQPIELTLSTYDPPPSAFTVTLQKWAEEVEAAAGGRVKCTLYHSQALGKSEEHYDMAVTGRADVTKCAPGYTPGRFPLFEVNELPLIFPYSAKSTNLIFQELFEKLPELQKEFADVKVLAFVGTTSRQIMNAKRPVRTVEDLKGLKLRAGGATAADTLTALGAVPLAMPPTEIYTSVERGTLDGVNWEWEGFSVFRIQELAKYATVVNLNSYVTMYAMNRQKYDSLPSDIRAIIDKLSGSHLAELAGENFDKGDAAAYEKVKPVLEIYELPAAERDIWVKAVRPVWDKWVADREAKGLPARKVLDAAIEVAKKYTK